MAAPSDCQSSPDENADDTDNGLTEEIELLQAIYIDELSIEDDTGKPRRLLLDLHPATGENTDQRLVYMILDIELSHKYPLEVPDISIRNPRGLACEHIASLLQSLRGLAEEKKGGPMLYELIEVAKESLTQGNIPYGQCVICMEPFGAADVVTKTECYHYLHCHCLLRYIQHHLEAEAEDNQTAVPHMKKEEKQILCPVCREVIQYDLAALNQAPAPPVAKWEYQPDEDMKLLQQEMKQLFLKQKEKGGIIDIDAERNKFLIPAVAAPVPTSRGTLSSSPVSETNASPATEAPNTSTDQGGDPDIVSARQSTSRPSSGRGRGRGRGNRPRYDRNQGSPRSGRDRPGQGRGHRYMGSGRRRDDHMYDDGWDYGPKSRERHGSNKRDNNEESGKHRSAETDKGSKHERSDDRSDQRKDFEVEKARRRNRDQRNKDKEERLRSEKSAPESQEKVGEKSREVERDETGKTCNYRSRGRETSETDTGLSNRTSDSQESKFLRRDGPSSCNVSNAQSKERGSAAKQTDSRQKSYGQDRGRKENSRSTNGESHAARKIHRERTEGGKVQAADSKLELLDTSDQKSTTQDHRGYERKHNGNSNYRGSRRGYNGGKGCVQDRNTENYRLTGDETSQCSTTDGTGHKGSEDRATKQHSSFSMKDIAKALGPAVGNTDIDRKTRETYKTKEKGPPPGFPAQPKTRPPPGFEDLR